MQNREQLQLILAYHFDWKGCLPFCALTFGALIQNCVFLVWLMYCRQPCYCVQFRLVWQNGKMIVS